MVFGYTLGIWLWYSLSCCYMRFKGFVGYLQGWWLKAAVASRLKQSVWWGAPTGDHHRVVGHFGLFFWSLVIVRVKGVSFFYCQLYFLVRFFSCVVFVFWFTCRLDI